MFTRIEGKRRLITQNQINACSLITVNFIGIQDGEEYSEDWTNELDRGKLVYVSNETYMVFISMEIELHKHLNLAVNGTKEKLQALVEDDNVQYHWSILAA